jgi:hypothetical protein
MKNNKNIFPKWQKINPQIVKNGLKMVPGAPWGEVLEPTWGTWQKGLDFDSILATFGLLGGLLGGPWWEPFSPLDLSQGAPKEPGEPFFGHLW